MKRFGYALAIAVMFFGTAAHADAIGYLWHHMPPIITGPGYWLHVGTNESVTYSWQVNIPDSIDYFEVQFANAPPYTTTPYNPGPGGSCTWDEVRIIGGYSFTTTHQEDHEPIYWRVRTVYFDGTKSHWAVGYHLVGDVPGVVPPPSITGPFIRKYSCSTSVTHTWMAVPGADHYEVAFANACPYGDSEYEFEDCAYDPVRIVYGTIYETTHQCIHMPIYFLIRGVFSDGSKTNWAISYYFTVQDCQTCCWPQPPVATEESTWGSIKQLYK